MLSAKKAQSPYDTALLTWLLMRAFNYRVLQDIYVKRGLWKMGSEGSLHLSFTRVVAKETSAVFNYKRHLSAVLANHSGNA